MEWNGRRFFHIPYRQFSSIHFNSIPKIFHSIFHSILKFSSIFHSILKLSSIFHSMLPYQRNFRLEATQRIFCCFAPLQCCKQPFVKVCQQYLDQQPVSGMHISHSLMHRRSLGFKLKGGLNRKLCNDVRSF